MFKRIDHIEIVCPDMDKCIGFYTDVLGFKVKERRKLEGSGAQEIAFLELADTTLEILAISSAAALSSAPWTAGYRMMAIEVDDMDQTVEYLRSKGIELSQDPRLIGKSKRAEIKDPTGLSIEIRQW